ncbi:MAG: Planctomycete cytochrome [Gemmataceae bacterium]|nr:Planctomycete cytochrome [Gemmataceae bacterium]
MRISCLAAVAAVAGLAPDARSAEPTVDNEFFENKVRPILVANCTSCHGAEKQKGSLRLDSRPALMKGGDTGPAMKPGDPAASLLVQMVRYDGDIKMPPKGKLAAEDVAVLTAWVKGGAPWPEGGSATQGGPAAKFDIAARAKAHWSFQPVKRPAVPDLRGHPAPRNPVDAFLLAKLEPAGLTFAPPAEKRVLIRRVYFDLIGLPPTPEEVEAFAADGAPDAFEKVVEKLLASPHYGERWGRHWLDLVRYAETCGHEFDFEIPDAWRYRDYVIRAFNADVPYDRFLTEHLAGDLLATPRRNPKDGTNESLAATGFWYFHEALHSPVDVRKDQADRIDNQIDVFGKTVLGLTLACARCHDHKFDPIATRDYYALFGVLASSRYQRADVADPAPAAKLLDELKSARADLESALTAAGHSPVAAQIKPGADVLPSPGQDWRSKAVAFERFDAGWRRRWDAAGLGLRPEAGDGFPHSGRELDRLGGALRSPTFTIDKPLLAARVAGRDAKARVVLNGLHLIQNPIYGGLAQPVNHGDDLKWVVFDLRMWKGQTAYLELLDDGPGYVAVSEVWFADASPPAEPGARVPTPPQADLPPAARETAEVKRLAARIRELEGKIPGPQRAPAMRDGTGQDERVFIRGNPKNLGVEAPRAFPEVFGRTSFTSAGSGRLDLAKAATDPANPLVARVMVNRIWKHHFGEGIVRSPDDFGYQGQPPTHPELLDWLAAEFVARGWSVKQMHRLIVLSTAYQQSARATPDQAAKAVTADPLNKLLYRQTVRRLEAEVIRDAMLAVSGRLDRAAGGPGVLPYLTEHSVGRGKPASGPLDGNGRRSIYLQVRRNFLNPMFVAFDYPTPFTTIGRRTVSNVPAQALTMLNNPFVLQQAGLWANRTLAAPGRTPEQRVQEMYKTAFGRAPTKDEDAIAVGFVAELSMEYGKPDHPKAWADLAHVLFNAKEFIFVE